MTYGLIEPNFGRRKEYIGKVIKEKPGSIIFGYADFDKALNNFLRDKVQIILLSASLKEKERIEFEEYIKEQNLPLTLEQL